MRSNSVGLALPLVATGPFASSLIDVGSGFGGFSVQFVNVTAASGVQYAIEGSLDGGNWIDITRDLGSLLSPGALSPPIVADGIYDYPARFPGSIRIVCKHAPDSAPAPSSLPRASVAYQDMRVA